MILMQLTCPNCSQRIRAENINVQEFVAVCANCDTVFPFKSPAEKNKRRKVKQPQNLSLHDGQHLEMSFRTNWRLSSNENFVGLAIGTVMTIFVATLTGSEFLISGEIPLIIPAAMAMLAIFFTYLLGILVYNRTHIVMDEEKIAISRKPIPVLFNQGKEVSLYGVESIKCEETPISIKEAYDLPRYRVWAETADGSRRIIINDVTEEYAYFISQHLDERLHYDVSHLEDADHNKDENMLHSGQLDEDKKALYRG